MRPVWIGAVAACAASLAPSGAALAHHSGAAFDMTRVVTIEGTIAELHWKNPHVYFTVETTDRDGAPLLQEIEAMSVSQARGLGLRREAISPGERVVVRAAPNRRGEGRQAFGLTITTADGAVMPLSSFVRFSAASPPVAEAQGLSGRWTPTVESFVATVAAGGAAPVTDAGRAAREEAMSRYSSLDGGGAAICEPMSPPLLHVFPDPRVIEVSEASVVIRTETNGVEQERIVHLDQREHPADLEPTVEGHSIGWWEGETLVIDTVGFAPSETPDLTFLPIGPATHLVEKLTPTEDRRRLDYEFTLDNAAYLAAPAAFRATWDYRPDIEPLDEACDPDIARRFLEE